ncbi:peptidylprolyl isomerase [Flavicella marina]|uniref:peptidylprolyl isomerase n=1 Tax=Flavicella marina TaxID=1475951 RepID=UPI0012642E05|nr:peptidylprolyl isomerase [Flavicella marina]
MIKNFKTFSIFLLFSLVVTAQKEKVLLKIDKEPVYASEFKRLFGKNQNLKIQNEPSSIDDDMQLFVDYKLKILEAEALQLDTVSSYIEELARYRNQLALPYLNDDSQLDSLTREAYERSLTEVRASHILIRVEENATDTVAAYQKISALRDRIVQGEDFEKVAKENSQDPSAKSNGGDLGYFSVFRMVYPFECAAYATEKGKVSEIFRSQFGYHILKVTDVRDSQGEMEVAHIMIRDTTAAGAQTIDKVFRELLKEDNFEELAKKYSDDKRSAQNGGRLNKFTIGAMPVPFGEKSFELSENNKYSNPFRTDYGWHIVKYIQHYPVKSFDAVEKEFRQKTKRDSRSKTLANPVLVRLKKEYAIQINEAAKKDFENPSFTVNDSINKWLITIEKDTLMQKDFYGYIMNRRHKKALENFQPFLDEEILNYYKEHLEETNEEFKYLFQEYKYGLLMFDLMKLEIWDKAQNDTIGLQEFYQLHKTDYIKPALYTSAIVSTKDSKQVATLKATISKADSVSVIQEEMVAVENVLLKSGSFEKDNAIFPEGVDYSLGAISVLKDGDYTVLVKVFEVQEAKQEEFDDVKGKVTSDYQNEIQEKWLTGLRNKHKVKIYKRRVKELASEMEVYSE